MLILLIVSVVMLTTQMSSVIITTIRDSKNTTELVVGIVGTLIFFLYPIVSLFFLFANTCPK